MKILFLRLAAYLIAFTSIYAVFIMIFFVVTLAVAMLSLPLLFFGLSKNEIILIVAIIEVIATISVIILGIRKKWISFSLSFQSINL